LNEITKLKGRSLENLETLLQLGCEHLLHRKPLDLLHAWSSHKRKRTVKDWHKNCKGTIKEVWK
jgi:hypothetical protein